MTVKTDSPNQEVPAGKPYTFEVTIYGDWYYEPETFQKEVVLTADEVATIKRLVAAYKGDLADGILPVLGRKAPKLRTKIRRAALTNVVATFIRRDEFFEPKSKEDEERFMLDNWTEADLNHLMRAYADHVNFEGIDDVYVCHIPAALMP